MGTWDNAVTISVETEQVIDENPEVWLNAAWDAVKNRDFYGALDALNNVKRFDAGRSSLTGNAYALEIVCYYEIGNAVEAHNTFSHHVKDGLEMFLQDKPGFVVQYCRYDTAYWGAYWDYLTKNWFSARNYARLKEFVDDIDDVKFANWTDMKVAEWIVEKGEWKCFQKLIRGRFDFNLCNYRKGNLLMLAASVSASGARNILEYLLEHHVYPLNKVDIHGCTALMLALKNKEFPKANLILQYRPNVNIRNDEGQTALHVAAISDAYGQIESIVSLGANVDERDNDFMTPIHYSIEKSNVAVLRKLLCLGASNEVKTKDGRTPLHYLVQKYGQSDDDGKCLKALIENGADIERTDDEGLTPVAVAACHGWHEGVEILARSGANLNRHYDRFSYNGTIMHSLARGNHWNSPRKEIWQTLLRYNAEVNVTDDRGYTPLMYSVDHNWTFSDELGMARALVRNGANKNVRADDGNTVFSIMRSRNIAPDKLDNNSSSNVLTKFFS